MYVGGVRVNRSFSAQPRVLNTARVMASCRPRLFVHALPGSYRDVLFNVGIGEPINGSSSTLYSTEQYSLGAIFHERALAYPCRTHDAAAADLLFIPAFKAHLRTGLNPVRCAEPAFASVIRNGTLEERARMTFLQRLRPALERRGGADHIIVQPRTGMRWEQQQFCEVHDFDPALGAALRLSMEHDASVPAVRGASTGYASMPWPSSVHADPWAPRGHPWPWKSSHEYVQS